MFQSLCVQSLCVQSLCAFFLPYSREVLGKPGEPLGTPHVYSDQQSENFLGSGQGTSRKFWEVSGDSARSREGCLLPGDTQKLSQNTHRERRRLLTHIERGGKTPTRKISASLRKRPVLLRANFVLTKAGKRPHYGHFCGKIHKEGSTHPKTQVIDRFQNLRFRVCCVFGCSLFPSKKTPKHIRKHRFSRKHRFWERSITCIFGCVAFSGALWRLPNKQNGSSRNDVLQGAPMKCPFFLQAF